MGGFKGCGDFLFLEKLNKYLILIEKDTMPSRSRRIAVFTIVLLVLLAVAPTHISEHFTNDFDDVNCLYISVNRFEIDGSML